MANPVAEFVGTSKTYRSALRSSRSIEALRDVHLTIEAGQVFALLGPNRAGKTTLIKILLGLCRPTAGRTTRLGKPLSDRSTLARIGYMHENQAFPRYLTARQLLRMYGKLAWVPAASLDASIPSLLERVGLSDRAAQAISIRFTLLVNGAVDWRSRRRFCRNRISWCSMSRSKVSIWRGGRP